MKSPGLRRKRHLRVRAKVQGTAARPRLSVFRSSKHAWVQLIDDERGHTLAAANDREKSKIKSWKIADFPAGAPSRRREGDHQKSKITKTEHAFEAGKAVAAKALALGIKTVVFDRGGYKYHGRVKALAEGARAGGLKF